jgi:hypothetical protein
VWRSLAAGVVLAIPVALTLGSTVRKDVDAIREHSRLSFVETEIEPPFAFPGYRNVPLLLGIRRLVPEDGSIAFVPRGGPAARRIYLQTGWARWAAFAVAPRVVVDDATAPWLVVVGRSPREAGLRVRRAWRFGSDWLAER